MKYAVTILTVIASVLLLAFQASAQDRFDRSATLMPEADLNVGGYGNIVAGVDFDEDGRTEIYFVNNNWKDGIDVIPRIYKYEKNDADRWELVWSTMIPATLVAQQNTWPPLSATDLDQDGKMELLWGPVNFLDQLLNPARIVVYETPGDGSDNMGIDNGDGTWAPNASFTIASENSQNIRPFRWIVTDIDGDGTDEIVTALRAGDERAQIYSVDDVPDTGDGSETWTIEFAGLGTTTHYDLAVIGSTAYFISSGGDITSVTWDGSAYVVGPTQATGIASWKSASVVDIDDNGTEEIVYANWFGDSNDVWVFQQSGDTLVGNAIANFDAFDEIRALNGGDAGDVDGDGNMDFIFGTRDFDTPPGDMNHVVRVEYQGGDITDAANYEISVVDRNAIAPQGTQADVIHLANVDDDAEHEILYAGVTRPFASGGPPILPVVVLDRIPGNQPVINAVADVPNDQGRQVWVIWQGSADDVGGLRMSAHLSGANQPDPVASAGSGKASFVLNDERTALSYLLEVNNIDSVTQAHIHVGEAGVNGPVAAFLFGLVDGGGPVNGILASGVITEDDLIGPFAGDMEGFLNALLTGGTYVNVHTTTNPGGEIRGQILTDPMTRQADVGDRTSAYDISHYIVWRIDAGRFPVQLARVDAIQAPAYAAVVPTLGDGPDFRATYVVSAHTPNTTVLWKSFPKRGVSEDNLVPTAPANLMAGLSDGTVQLSWDESQDPDINYFAVYRGAETGFTPSDANVIGTTTETVFLDSDVQGGETWYYRVRGFDFNANVGELSEEVNTTVVGIADNAALPREFALRQNYPNPFNPETMITFDLPRAVDVTLKIYNIRGQEVRTLVSDNQAAGTHQIRWDGLSNSGQRVSSGVYIYTIKAGEFVQSKKMTLLK